MTEHTPTPWSYRPALHDDWGWIRGPKEDDGIAPLVAVAKSGKWERESVLDQHRINKTDPYAANAAFIVTAVNNHDILVKELESQRDYWAQRVADIAGELQEGEKYSAIMADRIGHFSERAEHINAVLRRVTAAS